jgi:hypothetical protein
MQMHEKPLCAMCKANCLRLPIIKARAVEEEPSENGGGLTCFLMHGYWCELNLDRRIKSSASNIPEINNGSFLIEPGASLSCQTNIYACQ